MYSTGVRKGIPNGKTATRGQVRFDGPHTSSPQEYGKGRESSKANKEMEREEGGGSNLPRYQRRVEMRCLLASRTSFAARSRRIFRRIFPDGLKTTTDISFTSQRSTYDWTF